MIVVDTTVWVDYFRGTRTPHADWLEANLTSERLGLTDLILCEVLQGVPTDSQFDAVQKELLRRDHPLAGMYFCGQRLWSAYRRLEDRRGPRRIRPRP